MNQADKEKMNQIIRDEIEKCFETYLKCETYVNEDNNVRVSINFLDTEKDIYNEEQMESYKDTINTYLENSEFNASDFEIIYYFDGTLTLSYLD